MQSDKILDGDRPNLYLMGLINSLTDRVFTSVYMGSGAPAAGLGEANDLYIDLAGLTFYAKDATGWDAGTALDNNTNTVLLISSK
jgi:hypothetical protein